MPEKKKKKIKHFLGCIPAFLNDPINFCFNMEALSARSRRFFGSTRFRSRPMWLDWRLLNPVIRVSDLKDVLGLISMPKVLRNDAGRDHLALSASASKRVPDAVILPALS